MNATEQQISDTSIQSEDGLDQYLTFMLADEEYGVDILRVQEIKGWEGVTSMPNTPEDILGVINLRGTIVPIVDLRTHFDLEGIAFDASTVVIVVRVSNEEHGERIMGIVVDAVSEVHNIGAADLKPAPDFGGTCNAEFIKGLVALENKMLIILDIDRLMNDGVLNKLDVGNAEPKSA